MRNSEIRLALPPSVLVEIKGLHHHHSAPFTIISNQLVDRQECPTVRVPFNRKAGKAMEKLPISLACITCHSGDALSQAKHCSFPGQMGLTGAQCYQSSGCCLPSTAESGEWNFWHQAGVGVNLDVRTNQMVNLAQVYLSHNGRQQYSRLTL